MRNMKKLIFALVLFLIGFTLKAQIIMSVKGLKQGTFIGTSQDIREKY